MNATLNLNSYIIEGLYGEALVLSDAVRAAFDMSGQFDDAARHEGATRIALSCEALRTTTRMMHAVAWLLNHRAYLLGEISEFQLRRYGRLIPDFPTADPQRMALLDDRLRELISVTEHFYARLLRLDRQWREADIVGSSSSASAISRLRQRLA